MRSVIVGMGIQGRKRAAIAGPDVVATVDPVSPEARYRAIEDVRLDSFDAALVCTPDAAKHSLLKYLLSNGKHVLVEKPLLVPHDSELQELQSIARRTGAACYTAYNHRFEPHLRSLKQILDSGTLGKIHQARFFYGNGTARDVRNSPWRDKGSGVLTDLGSHLLDLSMFLFGSSRRSFRLWACHRLENLAPDHCLFGSEEPPVLQCEMTLLSWRNHFTLDVVGELGSAHVQGLCKWGPNTLTIRRRQLPSGKPREEVRGLEQPDPTWELEYAHFKELCAIGANNLANDLWINVSLQSLATEATKDSHGATKKELAA